MTITRDELANLLALLVEDSASAKRDAIRSHVRRIMREFEEALGRRNNFEKVLAQKDARIAELETTMARDGARLGAFVRDLLIEVPPA